MHFQHSKRERHLNSSFALDYVILLHIAVLLSLKCFYIVNIAKLAEIAQLENTAAYLYSRDIIAKVIKFSGSIKKIDL